MRNTYSDVVALATNRNKHALVIALEAQRDRELRVLHITRLIERVVRSSGDTDKGCAELLEFLFWALQDIVFGSMFEKQGYHPEGKYFISSEDYEVMYAATNEDPALERFGHAESSKGQRILKLREELLQITVNKCVAVYTMLPKVTCLGVNFVKTRRCILTKIVECLRRTTNERLSEYIFRFVVETYKDAVGQGHLKYGKWLVTILYESLREGFPSERLLVQCLYLQGAPKSLAPLVLMFLKAYLGIEFNEGVSNNVLNALKMVEPLKNGSPALIKYAERALLHAAELDQAIKDLTSTLWNEVLSTFYDKRLLITNVSSWEFTPSLDGITLFLTATAPTIDNNDGKATFEEIERGTKPHLEKWARERQCSYIRVEVHFKDAQEGDSVIFYMAFTVFNS